MPKNNMEDDDKENDLQPPVDQHAGDIGHGVALVAHRQHKRAEIMHRTHENGAEQNPDQGRHPAPEDRHRRADNRAGAGNGGEVVAEEHGFVGGDKINAVMMLHTRAQVFRRHVEDFLRQVFPVGVVGGQIQQRGAKDHPYSSHNNSFPLQKSGQ